MTIKTLTITANFSSPSHGQNVIYRSDAEWNGVFTAAADEFSLTDDCITIRTRRHCLIQLRLVGLPARLYVTMLTTVTYHDCLHLNVFT